MSTLATIRPIVTTGAVREGMVSRSGITAVEYKGHLGRLPVHCPANGVQLPTGASLLDRFRAAVRDARLDLLRPMRRARERLPESGPQPALRSRRRGQRRVDRGLPRPGAPQRKA